MGVTRQVQLLSQALLDVFYPATCQICSVSLNTSEKHVCHSCAYDLPYIGQNHLALQSLQKLFWGRVEVEHVFSLLNYQRGNQTQRLLHQLKYHKKTKLGVHFGAVLGGLIPANSGIDLILPVPLHPKKERQRGFNQSLMIANGIAQKMEIPVVKKILKRKAFNRSQTQFSKYNRWENVREIFAIHQPQKLENKHVLLVDDVLTTGATIEACVRELLKVNKCSVSIAALAARV